jgi:hypothetical protein
MRFGAAAGQGEVLIGEYRSNPRREAVTLYAVADNRLTPRWRFGAGTVRHIHAVQTDPYDGDTWVTTGDYGRECRILRSHDGMRTADLVGWGDQTWRSTALLFDSHAVYWGMDSPLERCFVFRWDKCTGSRSVVEELPGPIWHAASNDNGWFSFATAVEPSRIFREPYAYLYAGRLGRLDEIARFTKDRWSTRWFQPGLIFFPAGAAPADYLVYSGSGLDKLDDVMVIGRLAG